MKTQESKNSRSSAFAEIERALLRIRSQQSSEDGSSRYEARAPRRLPQAKSHTISLNKRRRNLIELSVLLCKARENPQANTIEEISNRLMGVRQSAIRKPPTGNKTDKTSSAEASEKEKRLSALVRLAVELRKYSEETLCKDACQSSNSDMSTFTEATVPSYVSFEDHDTPSNRILLDEASTLPAVKNNDDKKLQDRVSCECTSSSEHEVATKHDTHTNVDSDLGKPIENDDETKEKKGRRVQFAGIENVVESDRLENGEAGSTNEFQAGRVLVALKSCIKQKPSTNEDNMMLKANVGAALSYTRGTIELERDSDASTEIQSDSGSESEESNGVDSYILESLIKAPYVSGLEPEGCYMHLPDGVLHKYSRDSGIGNVGKSDEENLLVEEDPRSESIFSESPQIGCVEPKTRSDDSNPTVFIQKDPLIQGSAIENPCATLAEQIGRERSRENEDRNAASIAKVTNATFVSKATNKVSHPNVRDNKQQKRNCVSRVDKVPSEVSIVKTRPLDGVGHCAASWSNFKNLMRQGSNKQLESGGVTQISSEFNEGSNAVDEDSWASSLTFRCEPTPKLPKESKGSQAVSEYWSPPTDHYTNKGEECYGDEYNDLLIQTLQGTLEDLKAMHSMTKGKSNQEQSLVAKANETTQPRQGTRTAQSEPGSRVDGDLQTCNVKDINGRNRSTMQGQSKSQQHKSNTVEWSTRQQRKTLHSLNEDLQKQRDHRYRSQTTSPKTTENPTTRIIERPNEESTQKKILTVQNAPIMTITSSSTDPTKRKLVSNTAAPSTSVAYVRRKNEVATTQSMCIKNMKQPLLQHPRCHPQGEPIPQDSSRALRARTQLEADLEAKRRRRRSRIKKGSVIPDAPSWDQLLGIGGIASISSKGRTGAVGLPLSSCASNPAHRLANPNGH